MVSLYLNLSLDLGSCLTSLACPPKVLSMHLFFRLLSLFIFFVCIHRCHLSPSAYHPPVLVPGNLATIESRVLHNVESAISSNRQWRILLKSDTLLTPIANACNVVSCNSFHHLAWSNYLLSNPHEALSHRLLSA